MEYSCMVISHQFETKGDQPLNVYLLQLIKVMPEAAIMLTKTTTCVWQQYTLEKLIIGKHTNDTY